MIQLRIMLQLINTVLVRAAIQKLHFLIYLIVRKFSLHGTKFSFIFPIAFFNAKNSFMLHNLFSIIYRGFRTVIV